MIAPPMPLTTELELMHRDLPEGVAAGAADLIGGLFADRRVQVRAEDLERAFHTPSARPGVGALAADIARLARAYAARTGERVLEIRLERITDDACRAFHRDNVRMRLLTTYVGPGTQYVADADAEAALELQGRFSGAIHAAPTGALAWMCGAQAGAGRRGLVHRSPPIAVQGGVRLLLAVNEAMRGLSELWTDEAGPVLACSNALV